MLPSGLLSAPSRGTTFFATRLHWRPRQRYSALVHEHFTNPKNVGAFDPSDPRVGTAVVGKAACGDVIKLQVQVDGNIIKDVRFKAFGCGSAIASSSYASEMIKGLSLDDALLIKNSDIADSLALPPVKIHCSLLAEDAIRLAIKDFRARSIVAGAPPPCGSKLTSVEDVEEIK